MRFFHNIVEDNMKANVTNRKEKPVFPVRLAGQSNRTIVIDDPDVAELWVRYFKSGSQTKTGRPKKLAGQEQPKRASALRVLKYRSVQMPPAFWDDLETLAKVRSMSLHSLMRYVLLEWMAKNQAADAQPKLDKAYCKANDPAEIRSCEGRR